MTAKEIQEQIRRIEEFTRAKAELGRIEKEYQRTLGETYRLKKSTKKIDDALEAAANNLEQRERRAIIATNKYNAELEYRQELNKKYGAYLGNIERQLKTLKITDEKGLKRQKELNKKKKHYSELINKNRKYIEGYRKAIKAEGVSLNSVRSKYEQVEKLRASYTALPVVPVKNEKEFDDAVKQRMAAEEEFYGKIADSMGLAGKERDEYIASLRAGNKEEDISNKLLAVQSEELQKQIKDRAHIAKLIKEGKFAEVRKEVQGEIGNVIGQMGKVWSSKGVMGTVGAAKGAYEGISRSSGRLKMIREEMSKVGKSAKGFAGAMQLLGKAFSVVGKMNWIALIITAITVIGKTLNEFDKFIKEYNKDFAKMYGPTIALKNVKASIKEFTTAVFNMNRNLKYGISSKEIMGMFEAMSAGGLSLRGVGQRVSGGYNEVIEEAAKLSYDFGVSMEEMGSMIGSQMIDLRSTMSSVSDAMQRMAYDASIAGIKSQKFYEATYAAADALSYYGNFLSSASALLKTFSKAGAMGFKDASREAQEFMGLFEKMGSTQRMGFISIVGEDKVRADLKTKASQLAKEESLLDRDIANMKQRIMGEKDSAKREELQRQLAAKEEDKATKSRARIMAEAGASGTIMAMQTALPLLADRTVDYTVTALERAGADIFDPESILRASKQLAVQTNMTEEAVTKFAYGMMASMKDVRETAVYLSDSFKNMGKETRDNLVGVMDKYIADIEAGKNINMDELETNIGPYVNQLGMTVEEFSKQFEKNAWLLRESLAGMNPKSMDYRKLTLKPMQNLIKVTSGKGAMRDKRIDELVKNTVTWEEFAGIGKESAKYLASMVGDGKLQDMANNATIQGTRGIFSILGFLERGGREGGWKSEEEFRDSPEWNDLVIAGRNIGLAAQKLSDAEVEASNAANNLSSAAEKDRSEAKARLDAANEKVKEAQAVYEKVKAAREQIKTSRPDLEGMAVSQGIEQASEYYKRLTGSLKRAIEKQEEIVKSITNRKGVLTNSEYEWQTRILENMYRIRARLDPLGLVAGETQQEMPHSDYALTAPTTEETIKDGIVVKGGMLKASAGDVFTQNKNMAKTISAGAGQFMNRALITHRSPGGGPVTSVVVPFNVNIGSFVGDSTDLARVLIPVMEQTFLRMNKEVGKRS